MRVNAGGGPNDDMHFSKFLTGEDDWTVGMVVRYVEDYSSYVRKYWHVHPEEREAFTAQLERMRLLYRLMGGRVHGHDQG